MNLFEVKKVLSVDSNLGLNECEKILVSENLCLGILDQNREIISFVIKEDLIRALKFNIKNHPISLIATPADFIDIDIDNPDGDKLKNLVKPGLNKGVFVGKNRRNIHSLIVNKNSYQEAGIKFLTDEFEKNIDDKIKKALKFCSDAADKISLPIFLIGGVVRDIIIGKKSFDVDITVEENSIEFSRFLRKEYPDICKIKEIHEDFKTTKMLFSIENEIIELDIASTRKESYQFPASLPVVEEIGCSIYEDIIRRDFTINSMALSLNKASWCKLTDPLDGYNDLKKGEIKILHPVSFVDDPTRIIRALKFSIRFDYELDNATGKLAESCISSGLFDNLAGERIKSEIKQTLNLNQEECLNRFVKEKIYYLADKNILIPPDIELLSEKTRKSILKYKDYISSDDLIWLIYLGVLIARSPLDKIIEISNKLYLSGLETEILLGAKSILNRIETIKSAKTRFEIYEYFEGYFPESVLIALINADDEIVSQKADLYIKELQDIKIYTTGKTLIEAGFVPGPIFGEVLRQLLEAKINQEISTQEDEIDFIKKISSREFRN